MKVGFPGGPRLEWYDRNAQRKGDSESTGNLGPHGVTTRISYTVPAGKKGFVEAALVAAIRITAATTPGSVIAAIRAQTPRILQAWFITNEVGDHSDQAIGQNVTLRAGETLAGDTLDLSTGGTCNYYLAFHVQEFDA